MSHRAVRYIATAVFVLGLAPSMPGAAGDAPKLSASYTVAEVNEGTDTVSMTFSFVLWTDGGKDVVVDRVILADAAKVDAPYATFAGGTLPARGKLKRSSAAVVPLSQFKSWKGSAATLFVYTRDDRGNTILTQVDAFRSMGGR